MSQRLGQTFVVRIGLAGQQMAANSVVKAAPDGYTLLMLANPNVINAVINPDISFSFTRDLARIGGIASDPTILVVIHRYRSNPCRS